MVCYLIKSKRGSYIRFDENSGRYVPVNNRRFATKFQSRDKAKNILQNAVSKQLRKNYKVSEVLYDTKDIDSYSIAPEETPNTKNEYAQVVFETDQKRAELISALSNIDKEISDINHYIEFTNLDAYRGWMAFSMLQKRLRYRRKIKDALCVINQVKGCCVDASMLQELLDEIDRGKRKKQYTPRVLDELFEKSGCSNVKV